MTFKVPVHKNRLSISTDNSYLEKIRMKDGLVQSPFENHGYGTRSIAAVANAHGGQAIFDTEAGAFS